MYLYGTGEDEWMRTDPAWMYVMLISSDSLGLGWARYFGMNIGYALICIIVGVGRNGS